MTDFSGYSFNRYHILERLGQGGMATVYKAYDTHLERDVAVKVIRRDAFSPEMLEQVLKRFEREARSLARLSHPNIVKVIDYGEYENVPYLVMEYLSGGTLKQKMGTPIPYGQAARLLAPIARALGYAHQAGMLHRDVKPANILFNDSGEPYLADFGIAKLLQGEGSTALTSTGMTIGTPEYMAPEQGLGQAVDGRADQYSLGVVFYEMITGRPPFSADTPLAVILKHINDPLPHPKLFVPGLPDEVVKLLVKILSKNPANRYADMDTLAAALERLAVQGRPTSDDQSTQMRPLPVPGGAGSTPRSAGLWLALGGGIFLAGILFILIASILSGLPKKLFGKTMQPGQENTTPLAQVVTNTPFLDLTSSAAAQNVGDHDLSSTQTVSVQRTQDAQDNRMLTITPTLDITQTVTPTAETRSKEGMLMISIPAGSFMMGSNMSAYDNEKPQHEVDLKAYSIDQTEVTNAIFGRFVAETGHQTVAEKEGWGYTYDFKTGKWPQTSGADWQHPSGPNSSIDGLQNHPVVQVAWQDAQDYCHWAGKRLPTEAEWEKAARWDKKKQVSRTYPWGDSPPAGDLLNFADQSLGGPNADQSVNDGYQYTAPVGSYPKGASSYGVLDIAGNVWEWVSDWFDASYYQHSPSSNPQGPPSGDTRVFRGGSWFYGKDLARSAYRGRIDADYRSYNMGFRCAK